MSEVIKELREKMEKHQKSIAVLTTCLEAYQTGLIQPPGLQITAVCKYAVDEEGYCGVVAVKLPPAHIGKTYTVTLTRCES